jgi:hypothetical protein
MLRNATVADEGEDFAGADLSPTESVIALIVLSLPHQEMDWECVTGNSEVDSHKIASGLPTNHQQLVAALRCFARLPSK